MKASRHIFELFPLTLPFPLSTDYGLLSDLSAAYLARATQADEPADIPKALEAAEKAVALKNPPDEASAIPTLGSHPRPAGRLAGRRPRTRESNLDGASGSI